ncbi:hypothetical protein [Natronococcus amylolyticus]|uniref:hypothetical protein n=1 Tax=Natronococcus amylolyticus TaxID=44470 RepID=UPI001268E8EF|nr:hypothetical protein [Natronococcus amylolyticus]
MSDDSTSSERVFDDADALVVLSEDRVAYLEQLAGHQERLAEEIGEIRGELTEMNQTLESTERHIHVLPPESDINSPLVTLELTGAVFAFALGIGELMRTGEANIITTVGFAIGGALVVPPLLSYTT